MQTFAAKSIFQLVEVKTKANCKTCTGNFDIERNGRAEFAGRNFEEVDVIDVPCQGIGLSALT